MGLTDILGGSLTDGVAKIISLFKVDPNKAAEHAAELAKIQADIQSKMIDAAQAEIEAASANIRAEQASGDKYTQRARPSFVYMVLVILFANYVILPLVGRPLIALPDSLFWLFGSAILGYTGARSWEKVLSLPGDSEVSLPFGVKASNSTKGAK
jgi:hypothetical protein